MLRSLQPLVALALLAACGADDQGAAVPALPGGMARVPTSNANARPPAVPFDSTTPRVVARASRSWPHDTGAYTQGLVVHAGRLLEGTGLEGHSELREVDRATGTPRNKVPLAATLFGEGIAVVGERLFQLTWRSGRGYVYDASTLARVDSFTYVGEGWGLTTDGAQLYLSDGSNRIRVLDPATYQVTRTIDVRESGNAVWMLNELEWIRDELWANIYTTDWIARIDPGSGRVIGWIDVGTLLTPPERADVAARGGVANGIAYDSATTDVLFTGKRWPRLFEVPLASLRPRSSAR